MKFPTQVYIGIIINHEIRISINHPVVFPRGSWLTERQRMRARGVQSPPQRKVFRFHETILSFGEPGSLGCVILPHFLGPACGTTDLEKYKNIGVDELNTPISSDQLDSLPPIMFSGEWVPVPVDDDFL